VRDILVEIQRSAVRGVEVVSRSTESMSSALNATNDAGETINALSETVSDSARSAQQIAVSVGQQVTGVTQVRDAMKNIGEVTTKNITSIKQIEVSVQGIKQVGEELSAMVAGS